MEELKRLLADFEDKIRTAQSETGPDRDYRRAAEADVKEARDAILAWARTCASALQARKEGLL